MEIDWIRYKEDSQYRSEVLKSLREEQNKSFKDNPEVQTKQTQLDNADKIMTEKRTADEYVAENYGNKAWGKVGGLMLGAGAATTAGIYALPWIDAALTPSTYLDAIGAPSWIGTTANLGTSGYFAQDNAIKFKNDPNLINGVNTVLSFIPATRANYSELGKVGKLINGQRTGRQFFTDVKGIEFINKPIQHVSNKGITEGAGLRAASEGDVGFHFSPLGSETTRNLQKSLYLPFIREGWWTFTKNTSPIKTEDLGIWTKYFNPDFYKKAGKWEYPELPETVQDALHISQRGTNYIYGNKFEGGLSFMSTEPYMSIVLSNNSLAPKSKSRLIVRRPFFKERLLRNSLFKNRD